MHRFGMFINNFRLIISTVIIQFISINVQAQNNPLGNILGGIIGAAQTQQAAAEWQKTSQLLQFCFNTGLQRNRTNINGLIQNGIGPNDARLLQLKQSCEQYTNRSLKQNFSCNLTSQNGQNVTTQCDESFALQTQNGNLQQVTVEQAIVENFNNRRITIGQFERQDALTQRLNQQAEQARQAQIQAQIQAQKERELAEVQRKRAEEEQQRRIEADKIRAEAEKAKAEKAKADAEKAKAEAEAEKAKLLAAEEERKNSWSYKFDQFINSSEIFAWGKWIAGIVLFAFLISR